MPLDNHPLLEGTASSYIFALLFSDLLFEISNTEKNELLQYTTQCRLADERQLSRRQAGRRAGRDAGAKSSSETVEGTDRLAGGRVNNRA